MGVNLAAEPRAHSPTTVLYREFPQLCSSSRAHPRAHHLTQCQEDPTAPDNCQALQILPPQYLTISSTLCPHDRILIPIGIYSALWIQPFLVSVRTLTKHEPFFFYIEQSYSLIGLNNLHTPFRLIDPELLD